MAPSAALSSSAVLSGLRAPRCHQAQHGNLQLRRRGGPRDCKTQQGHQVPCRCQAPHNRGAVLTSSAQLSRPSLSPPTHPPLPPLSPLPQLAFAHPISCAVRYFAFFGATAFTSLALIFATSFSVAQLVKPPRVSLPLLVSARTRRLHIRLFHLGFPLLSYFLPPSIPLPSGVSVSYTCLIFLFT